MHNIMDLQTQIPPKEIQIHIQIILSSSFSNMTVGVFLTSLVCVKPLLGGLFGWQNSKATDKTEWY